MAFPFLEQLLYLNLVGRLKGGHWVFLALLFHFLKNNQLKHNIPQRHIFEIANSPFPCSYHCLHFIMSRVERQEKVRGPWQGWDLNPAAGLTLNCGEGGFTFSESFFKVMGQTAVTMAGGCTVYRSKKDLEGGFWVSVPRKGLFPLGCILSFRTQSAFYSSISGSAWRSSTNPSARKKNFFSYHSIFQSYFSLELRISLI